MSGAVRLIREIPQESAAPREAEAALPAAPAPVRGLWQRLCLLTGCWLLGLLILATLGSALAVTYTKHVSRGLVAERLALQRVQDELRVEGGRLLLEQTTWAAHGRIEQIARGRLGMVAPPTDSVMMIRP